MCEVIAKFGMRVDSIKRQLDDPSFAAIRAFGVDAMGGETLASLFFDVQDRNSIPKYGEVLLVTVERPPESTDQDTTDAVPEIPVPEAVRRRFREEAAADFGHGTQENQREYQRLIAKWQEEHPKGVDAADKPPWKCHLCESKEEGRHKFPCV